MEGEHGAPMEERKVIYAGPWLNQLHASCCNCNSRLQCSDQSIMTIKQLHTATEPLRSMDMHIHVCMPSHTELRSEKRR